jgi:hypothetical protein
VPRTVPQKPVPLARSLVGQLARLPAPSPAPPTGSRAPRRPASRDIGTITAPATRPASLQGRAEAASAYAPGAIPPGSRLRPDWPVSLDLRHFADNRRPGGLYGADDGDRFRGYITRAPS